MNFRSGLRKPLKFAHFNLTLILIAVNFFVYLLTEFSPQIVRYLGMHPQLVLSGYFWQPLSYMFVHAGFGHIFFNMLALFFFGTQIERTVGSWEFLLYYLLTGVLSGVFSLLLYSLLGPQAPFLLGASGAIYAVLFGFAAFYPDAKILLFGLIPIRSVVLVLGYTAIEVFSQLSGGRGVAHLTHLAGFLFAYLYFLIRFGKNPIREWFFAKP